MTRLEEKYRAHVKLKLFSGHADSTLRRSAPKRSKLGVSSLQSKPKNDVRLPHQIRMEEVDKIIAQLNEDEAKSPRPERVEDALQSDRPPSLFAPSNASSDMSHKQSSQKHSASHATSAEIRLLSQNFINTLRGNSAKPLTSLYLKNNSMFAQEDFILDVSHNARYRTRVRPIESTFKSWTPICTTEDIKMAAEDLWKLRKEMHY